MFSDRIWHSGLLECLKCALFILVFGYSDDCVVEVYQLLMVYLRLCIVFVLGRLSVDGLNISESQQLRDKYLFMMIALFNA
jgi:hypothetical protein